MVKTDYKPGDYIWGTYNQNPVRLITFCKIENGNLRWSETKDKIITKAWDLNYLRLATNEEIIAAGFKLKNKIYELW